MLKHPLILFFLFSCHNRPEQVKKKESFPVITQNAKHFYTGNELEINVQVEPLKAALNPTIQIDGIDVPINPNGIVLYSKVIYGAIGEHTSSIVITNHYPDNKTKVDNYTVNYFVDK